MYFVRQEHWKTIDLTPFQEEAAERREKYSYLSVVPDDVPQPRQPGPPKKRRASSGRTPRATDAQRSIPSKKMRFLNVDDSL